MATLVQQAFSATFGSNLTAGNLIIVGGASGINGDTLTVSDTRGSTFNALHATLSTGNLSARSWYAMNVTAGADTVTVTSGLGFGTDAVVYEVSGLATTSALDATASATGSTANGSSGNITVGGAGYLWGCIYNDAGNVTLNATFTERAVGSNNVRTDSGDNTTTSSGTVACSSTFSARNWVAVVANFLNAGGGGGGSAFPDYHYRQMRRRQPRVERIWRTRNGILVCEYQAAPLRLAA